jgi:arginase
VPRTHIAIIGAPLDLGQDRRGVDMGPSAVRVANLHARVASLGYEVEDWGNIPVEQKEAWPEGDPHAKYLALIASTCKALATAWTKHSPADSCRSCSAAIIPWRWAR